MSIKIFCGIPGSGKSYRLIHEGVRQLAQGKRYKRIFANFSINYDNLYIYLRRRAGLDRDTALDRLGRIVEVRNYNDLIDVQDGLLLFDEAHMWLPSGIDWAAWIPDELVAFITQHRKVFADIMVAVQRRSSLMNHLRENAEATYLVSDVAPMMQFMMRPITQGRRMLRYTLVQDDILGGQGNMSRSGGVFEASARTEYLILDPVIANCYDTNTIFEPPVTQIVKALALEGDKRARAKRASGLTWDMSKIMRVPKKPAALDGLPFLTVRDMMMYRSQGISLDSVMKQRLAIAYQHIA